MLGIYSNSIFSKFLLINCVSAGRDVGSVLLISFTGQTSEWRLKTYRKELYWIFAFRPKGKTYWRDIAIAADRLWKQERGEKTLSCFQGGWVSCQLCLPWSFIEPLIFTGKSFVILSSCIISFFYPIPSLKWVKKMVVPVHKMCYLMIGWTLLFLMHSSFSFPSLSCKQEYGEFRMFRGKYLISITLPSLVFHWHLNSARMPL